MPPVSDELKSKVRLSLPDAMYGYQGESSLINLKNRIKEVSRFDKVVCDGIKKIEDTEILLRNKLSSFNTPSNDECNADEREKEFAESRLKDAKYQLQNLKVDKSNIEKTKSNIARDVQFFFAKQYGQTPDCSIEEIKEEIDSLLKELEGEKVADGLLKADTEVKTRYQRLIEEFAGNSASMTPSAITVIRDIVKNIKSDGKVSDVLNGTLSLVEFFAGGVDLYTRTQVQYTSSATKAAGCLSATVRTLDGLLSGIQDSLVKNSQFQSCVATTSLLATVSTIAEQSISIKINLDDIEKACELQRSPVYKNFKSFSKDSIRVLAKKGLINEITCDIILDLRARIETANSNVKWGVAKTTAAAALLIYKATAINAMWSTDLVDGKLWSLQVLWHPIKRCLISLLRLLLPEER